jgi:UDP-GlcNAc:undecaprenyl-phosphate/decaprenyl-phosphate GlcNAc-1-phosphate transferase
MIFDLKKLIFLFLAVFSLSFFSTGWVRYIAKKLGWIAQPRKDRWHKKPVALHGGIGFFPPFFFGAIFIVYMNTNISSSDWLDIKSLSPENLQAIALLVGSFFMFVLGLIDDFKNLRPITKLLGQVIAASCFIITGGIIKFTSVGLIDFPVTYLWFLGITNAVNMLDNMDGLSSGVTIISSITLIVLMINYQQKFGVPGIIAIPLGVAFFGALCGFWIYNHPPASIFMGDSGSLFMGYFLAGLSVPSELNGFFYKNGGTLIIGSLFALIIPLTVLSVPIFDTTMVTLSRVWRGQSPSQGGRDHSSHRLVYLGLPEKHAVWFFYGVAATGGLVAILLQRAPMQSIPLFATFCLFLIFAGIYLARVKIRAVPFEQSRSNNWTSLVTNIMHKKQAATVMLDMIIIIICFYTSYLLRFEGTISGGIQEAVFKSIPVVVSSTLLINFIAGIYRNRWVLFSMADLPIYMVSSIGAALLSLALITILTRFAPGHSRSAYIIFGFLLFIGQVGSRLSFQLFDILLKKSFFRRNGSNNSKPILIYGAGKAGKLLFEEILDNSSMKSFYVAGFVDDDPNLANKILCGTKILSPAQCLSRSWQEMPEIWVSSRSISEAQIKEFLSQWDKDGPVVRYLQLQMKPPPPSE